MTCAQYADAHGCIGTAVSTHTTGALPMTGWEAWAVIGLAAAMIVLGLILTLGIDRGPTKEKDE